MPAARVSKALAQEPWCWHILFLSLGLAVLSPGSGTGDSRPDRKVGSARRRVGPGIRLEGAAAPSGANFPDKHAGGSWQGVGGGRGVWYK